MPGLVLQSIKYPSCRVPAELIRHILYYSDAETVQRFAAVNRFFYSFITSDQTLWYHLYEKTYTTIAIEHDWLDAHAHLLELPYAQKSLSKRDKIIWSSLKQDWISIDWRKAFKHRALTEYYWRTDKPTKVTGRQAMRSFGNDSVSFDICLSEYGILSMDFITGQLSVLSAIHGDSVNVLYGSYDTHHSEHLSEARVQPVSFEENVDVLVGRRYIVVFGRMINDSMPNMHFGTESRRSNAAVQKLYIWNTGNYRSCATISVDKGTRLKELRGDWLLTINTQHNNARDDTDTVTYCLYNLRYRTLTWTSQLGCKDVCHLQSVTNESAVVLCSHKEHRAVSTLTWQLHTVYYPTSASEPEYKVQSGKVVSSALVMDKVISAQRVSDQHVIFSWQSTGPYTHRMMFKVTAQGTSKPTDHYTGRFGEASEHQHLTLELLWEDESPGQFMPLANLGYVLSYTETECEIIDISTGCCIYKHLIPGFSSPKHIFGSLCLAYVDIGLVLIDIVKGSLIRLIRWGQNNMSHIMSNSAICLMDNYFDSMGSEQIITYSSLMTM
jgi:hypothetical protein